MASLDLLESAVLVAVFRGLDTPDALRKVINVDPAVLEEVIKKLVDQGLLSVELRGLIFKKPKLSLTRKGVEHLEQAMEKLKSVAGAVEAKIREQHEKAAALEPLDHTLYTIIPLLLWLGLIDATLLPPMHAYNMAPFADEAPDDAEEPEEAADAVEEADLDLDVDVEGDIV